MALSDVLAVVAALALPVLLFLAVLLGARRKRARLRRLTASGSATVVAKQATRVRVGYQPVVKFRMRLHYGERIQDEELELKIAVHPLEEDRVQIGAVFPLRFDPRQTADFSIDFGGTTGVALSDF